MTTPSNSPTMRRGACPGLAAPMQTGDGLLARIAPTATVSLAALDGLCAAAATYGNGVMEISARGSIQVRGLTPLSAPRSAEAVAGLDIDISDGVPVLASPLSGLEPDERFEAGRLASEMRHALAAQPFATALGPKVSVVIDSRGALHLDALAADVRLCADGDRLHVAIGGNAASATSLGTVAPDHAVDAAVELLRVIAARGNAMRARDIIAADGVDVFRAAIADQLAAARPLPSRPPSEPVGRHVLRDGRFGLGIALAFGHTDARTLQHLNAAAHDVSAGGVRLAPGRAVIFIDLTPDAADTLARAAERLGFITRPADPRRRIVACAGAPVCATGEIPARTLAPLAVDAAAALDGVIHISGCAKSCAHKGPAAITVIGRERQCDLMVGDSPAASVPVEALPSRLAELTRPRQVRP